MQLAAALGALDSSASDAEFRPLLPRILQSIENTSAEPTRQVAWDSATGYARLTWVRLHPTASNKQLLKRCWLTSMPSWQTWRKWMQCSAATVSLLRCCLTVNA